MKKYFLFIIIVCFSFIGFSQPVLKGQFYNLPVRGYTGDTIVSYKVVNNDSSGQAGFFAINGKDTAYLKLNSGRLVLGDDVYSVALSGIASTVEVDALADSLQYYTTLDSLSYYKDSASIADEQWTFSSDIEVLRKLRVDTLYWNPPHAWQRFADSSVTISLTQNNWGQITNASDSLFRVLELKQFSSSGDTLIPPAMPAHYNINCSFSFSGNLGNEYEVRLITNAGEINKMNFEYGVNGTTGSVSLPSFWNVIGDGNDKLWAEVRNTTDNDDITVISGIIIVFYYHFIE